MTEQVLPIDPLAPAEGGTVTEGAEAIADAVAEALASVNVAYTHNTMADMSTSGRSWKVHEAIIGENPFDRNEWLGEFDNKADANALAAKLRRERAVKAAARLASPTTGLKEALERLEKYADHKTAVAFSVMMRAKQDSDTDFADAMKRERDAYSDMTMQLRAALANLPTKAGTR